MRFLGAWLVAGVVLVLALWAFGLWHRARVARAKRLEASWAQWRAEQQERNRVMRGRP